MKQIVSEKLSLNEVTTERTDIDMNTDEVTLTNSKLNNGELSLDRVADLVVSGGELTNINVKVDSEAGSTTRWSSLKWWWHTIG